jgi:GAF domain
MPLTVYLAPDQQTSHATARQAAFDYAHGSVPKDSFRGLGVPRGHPNVRSFLGIPLLDRNKEVRGGLLLGHVEPGKFTPEHEQVLTGLASQASVALENARLYRLMAFAARNTRYMLVIPHSVLKSASWGPSGNKLIRTLQSGQHDEWSCYLRKAPWDESLSLTLGYCQRPPRDARIDEKVESGVSLRE